MKEYLKILISIKNISASEKGKKYFLENINKISIPTDDLSLKIDKIKMYLGIDNV